MPPATRCPKCTAVITVPHPLPPQFVCAGCGAKIKIKASPSAPAAVANGTAVLGQATVAHVSSATPKMPAGHVFVRQLAQGGLGVVYLARHEHLGDLRAIKRPQSSEPHLREQLVARFRSEVQAVGALRHEHVLRAYDAGVDEDGPYLVMEYLDGMPLSQLVAGQRGLPVPVACELSRQAALGLQAAHERGLVHRDVKPSNLMLVRTGSGSARVVVIDWGLAKSTGTATAASGLTSIGATLGTADYIAPEQIRDASSVDTRADVYGLGATLYTLLAGKPPFHGLPESEKYTAQQREAFPALQNVRRDLPRELLGIVQQMVDKEPARRFATPAEVAQALRPYCCGAASGQLLSLLGPAGAEHTTATLEFAERHTELVPLLTAGPRRRLVFAAGAALLGLLLLLPVTCWMMSGSAGKDTGFTQVSTTDKRDQPQPPKGPVLKGDKEGVIGKIAFPLGGRGGNGNMTNAGYWELTGTAIAFLPDGQRAIVRLCAARYSRLHFVDLLELIQRPVPLELYYNGPLSITPDGKRVAAAASEKVELYDGATYKKEGGLTLADACSALALAPDGTMLAAAEMNGKKGRIRFWNPAKRLPLDREALEFDTPVISLDFSPDSALMVTTNGGMNGYLISDAEDKKIRVWRAQAARSGAPLHELAGHPRAVSSAAFFADGRRLFSVSPFDGTLRVWSLEKGAEDRQPIQAAERWPDPTQGKDLKHPKHMTCVGFWPWGRAMTGYRFGGLTLWDLDTGKALAEFPNPSERTETYPVAVGISPDGHHALTLYGDEQIYLYRLPPPAARTP